jgi:hypothetical protein
MNVVAQRVVEVDLGVRWDGNVEHGVLLVQDGGPAKPRLLARIDDPDQRAVEIEWRGTRATRTESSNDEAISGHPLYDAGLRDVHWAGEVYDSDLIAELKRRNRVHPRHDAGRYSTLRHWRFARKDA